MKAQRAVERCPLFSSISPGGSLAVPMAFASASGRIRAIRAPAWRGLIRAPCPSPSQSDLALRFRQIHPGLGQNSYRPEPCPPCRFLVSPRSRTDNPGASNFRRQFRGHRPCPTARRPRCRNRLQSPLSATFPRLPCRAARGRHAARAGDRVEGVRARFPQNVRPVRSRCAIAASRAAERRPGPRPIRRTWFRPANGPPLALPMSVFRLASGSAWPRRRRRRLAESAPVAPTARPPRRRALAPSRPASAPVELAHPSGETPSHGLAGSML